MPKRHAEKRRTSTCRFADRVARISVDKYHELERQNPSDATDRFACVASIVAHMRGDDRLVVLAMGVGTKFLTESELESERNGVYGRRVRDCHAEVLARRAFRRELTLQMLSLQNGKSNVPSQTQTYILDRCGETENRTQCFKLKEGITLHM